MSKLSMTRTPTSKRRSTVAPLSPLLTSFFLLSLGCASRSSDTDSDAGSTSDSDHSETESNESNSPASTESSSHEDESDSSSGTGETGDEDPETPGEPEYSGECEAKAVDHSDDCGENCPLVLDMKVSCDDGEFTDPGFRVAPAPETTYLLTASSNFGWLMDMTNPESFQAKELPEDFARCTMSLALDPEGLPHIACDSTTPPSKEDPEGGLLYLAPNNGDFTSEQIYNHDKYIPLFDMEIDPSGQSHVWFSSDAPDERTEAIRDAEGNWTQKLITVPGDSGWQRFSTTQAGDTVAMDFDADINGGNESWFLKADHKGNIRKLGSSFGHSFPGSHVVITPPALPQLDTAGEDMVPDYFVLSQRGSAIHIAWPEEVSSNELTLAETALPEPDCAVDWHEDQACPESCEEKAVGVMERMTSLARTQDGRLWAAWMVAHYDQSMTFEEDCTYEDGFDCWCRPTITREESWGEIILAEIDWQSSESKIVFRLKDKDPHMLGVFTDYRESPRPFDMRAFGNDLAIGVRVRTHEDEPEQREPLDIRVLRVDTNMIE